MKRVKSFIISSIPFFLELSKRIIQLDLTRSITDWWFSESI